MACSVLASQLFGAKNYGGMKTAIYTVMISVAVLCGVMMLFGIVSANGILQFMSTPEAIYADSLLYMDIYIWGVPFLFFYNLSTGIFSAMGDSKTPFVFLAISSVANIGLNLFFVAVLDMGVAGVAWATFLCQGLSCFLGMGTVLLRLKSFPKVNTYFDPTHFKRFTQLAVPSILQQSSISIGTIIIQSLTPEFLDVLEEGFKEFYKKEVPENPLKAEYLIPTFIGELLKEGKMSVKVLKTNDTWYGMTYHEDVAAVKDSFKKMLDNNLYQADLFADL